MCRLSGISLSGLASLRERASFFGGVIADYQKNHPCFSSKAQVVCLKAPVVLLESTGTFARKHEHFSNDQKT
jgi:hypothetical protein